MREQNKAKAPTHRLVRWAPSFCRFAAREQNTHDKKRELNERYELSSGTDTTKEALHNQKIVERLLCTPSRGRTGTGFPIGV